MRCNAFRVQPTVPPAPAPNTATTIPTAPHHEGNIQPRHNQLRLRHRPRDLNQVNDTRIHVHACIPTHVQTHDNLTATHPIRSRRLTSLSIKSTNGANSLCDRCPCCCFCFGKRSTTLDPSLITPHRLGALPATYPTARSSESCHGNDNTPRSNIKITMLWNTIIAAGYPVAHRSECGHGNRNTTAVKRQNDAVVEQEITFHPSPLLLQPTRRRRQPAMYTSQ